MPELTEAALAALRTLTATLTPGAEVPLSTITTLLDETVGPDVLAELTNGGQLIETAPGRYRLNPTVQGASPGSDPEAVRHVVRHLTVLAVEADRHLYPHSWRLSPDYDNTGGAFDGPEAAMAWYHRNRALLLDSLRTALAYRHYEAAVRLAEPLWGLCRAAGHYDDEVASQHLGLDALEKEHQRTAAVFRARTAHAHTDAQDHANAEQQATLAVELARAADDPAALGTALSTRGRARHAAGRLAEAIADLEAALELAIEHEQPRSQALRHRHLGAVLADRGDHDRALAHLRQAVDLLHGLGDQLGYARALTEMGRIQIAAGDHQQASDTLAPALPITLDSGVDRYARDVLTVLATAADHLGHDDQARDYRVLAARATPETPATPQGAAAE